MAAQVAVFGEVLADCFPDGPVLGGAPFNVARHLAAFGLAPLMITAIGDDALGTQVLHAFASFGMRTDGVQHVAMPTGMVDVELRGDGDHTFRIRPGAAWDGIETAPALRCTSSLPAGRWLYAGTLALRGAVSRATGLALLGSHAGPRFIDLNWREGHTPPEVALQALAGADAIKVNDQELAMLCGWLGQPAAGIEQQAQAVVQHMKPRLLLVTCGADGAQAFGKDGSRLARQPCAPLSRLADTVGAGDAFSAVALAGLMGVWDIATLLARANAFAARVCETRGAMPEAGVHATHSASWQGSAATK